MTFKRHKNTLFITSISCDGPDPKLSTFQILNEFDWNIWRSTDCIHIYVSIIFYYYTLSVHSFLFQAPLHCTRRETYQIVLRVADTTNCIHCSTLRMGKPPYDIHWLRDSISANVQVVNMTLIHKLAPALVIYSCTYMQCRNGIHAFGLTLTLTLDFMKTILM